MSVPTSSKFCQCCGKTFADVKTLLAHEKSKEEEMQRNQNINPAKTKAKKRKINHANHHRTENQRKTTGRKNLKNVITGLSNFEVAEIPCNKTGTFIGNIIVKCTICSKTFDRYDEYLLHYGEEHARLYGMLPNLSNDNAAENINNKESNDSTFDAVIDNSHKKRSCTPKVFNNDETDTSSDSHTSDDEPAEKPIAVVEKDNSNIIVEKADVIDSVEMPNDNVNGVPKKKRKRDSSKSKQTDDHSSSSSDSDDSILEAQIENLLNTYVSKLTDLAKEFKDEIINMKNKQRKRIYKCDTCSLHFGKKGEWRRHMKKCSHSDIKKPQRSHCRRNSHKKILQENKMHIDNTEFYILETENGIKDNNTGNDREFVDKDQTTAPNSLSGNRRSSVKEPSQVNKILETNGPETENEHNEDTQVEPETVQIKVKNGKRILYKCDDCEEHFLNKENVKMHTKKGTHHRTEKNYVCDICMIKFSSSSTLKTHINEHKGCCLTKNDFKIIPWTFARRMPKNRQMINPKAKIFSGSCRQVSNEKKKRFLKPYDELKLYKCDGCGIHSHKYTTWISHTLNCKKDIPKEKCLKCDRYFSKVLLKTHEKIHIKKPWLKKDDFTVRSRKPVTKDPKKTVHQESNIASTINNDNKPVTNLGNVSENDPYRVIPTVNESNFNIGDILVQNPYVGESTDTNGQITVENDAGVQSPENSSYLPTVTKNTVNIDSTINLENPVSPQNEILNTANATNAIPSVQNEHPKEEFEFKDEFEPENDNCVPETQTGNNNRLEDINITEKYSTRLFFEDPDTKNSFETQISLQDETNVENITSAVLNIVEFKSLQSSHIHSNFDDNIAVYRTPRQHNNVCDYDDDSQATLVLDELPLDENFRNHPNDIESYHTENIGTPTETDINNEDDELNQSSQETDKESVTEQVINSTQNENIHENNDRAVENQASCSKIILNDRRKNIEYDFDQYIYSNHHPGNDSYRYRVRKRNEYREELEDLPEKRRSSKEYCSVDNMQEIIEVSDNDNDDDVVEITKDI